MADSERVLFVDDDPQVRTGFARAMRQAGFIVDVAESGEEALELVESYPYAVLVADWRMPGLDGLKLVAAIKRDGIEPTFLLATAASESDVDAIDRSALGIFAIVRKPWAHTELVETLHRAVKVFQTRRDGVRASLRASRSELRILAVTPGVVLSRALQHLTCEVGGYAAEPVVSVVEALERLERHSCDALVLDATAGGDVSEGVRRVVAMHPLLPVVVAVESEDATSLSLVQLGAQDVVRIDELSAGALPRRIAAAVERKRVESRLSHLANHDQLTGLGNRALLAERLKRALSRARRKESLVAVFFLDLDRFKQLNDSLGHDAGDSLLTQVARRLRASVRDTDTVARLGGDEFAVVLEDLERAEGAMLLAQRILNSFATPFRVAGSEVLSSTSIGISMYPHNGVEAEELLKCADAAMYRAKTEGRNNYQFFSEALHARALRQERLEAELREAVEREDFSLEFQPRLALDEHRVAVIEAQLRWDRADGAFVSPSEFVPVIEDVGLSRRLGEWALRRLCLQLQAWNESSGLNLRGALSVGGRLLETPEFVRTVAEVLAAYRLPGSALELTLSEQCLQRESQRLQASLGELKKLGVRVALDGFGSGSSSLTALARLPIDVVKVDLGLAREDTPRARGLLRATLAAVRHLVQEVVVTGVETHAQLEFAEAEHATHSRGPLLCPAVDARSCTRWLVRIAAGGGYWESDTARRASGLFGVA